MSTQPDTRERIYGVTVDQLEPLSDIVDALQMLGRKPTARIVFDPNRGPKAYAQGVHQIHAVSHVMGEVLDSVNVANVSVDDYTTRTQQFLDALSDDVDLWEIGNEINGEWLGESADVSAKILAAYRLVHGQGKPTALTLFYNQHCYMQADHEMFTWAAANIDAELKSGLDYVLISFYEDNCPAPSPDWNDVFSRLARIFPHSKLGFGECGTTNAANKAAYVARYYGLSVDEPSYVGGYFWWYFRQDMLPYTAPLWSVLNNSIVNTQ